MPGEFRFVFYPTDYERSVSFYRDGLGLAILGGWDRGAGDRGTLFRAAAGIIEILEGPGVSDAPHEAGPPRGAWMAIEVSDVDGAHEQVRERGLEFAEELESKSYGHRAFGVRDPDGLLVVFFQVV